MNFIKLLPIFSILFVSFPPQIQAQYVNENTISNALSQDSIWYMYSHPDTDYSLFRNQIVESICNDWEPFVSMIIDPNDSNSITLVAVMVYRALVDGLIEPFMLEHRMAYSVHMQISNKSILFSKPIIFDNNVHANPDPNGQNLDSLNRPESVIDLSNDYNLSYIKYSLKWLMQMIDIQLNCQ